ncbi:MAG: dienelactone hydrolase family protein [Chthoniobacter sp.]|nr:dienelactone hydrolase family protein [Chthoniobacter sp.]
MKLTAFLSAAVALAALNPSAFAKIKTEVVEYKDGDTVCEGFLAWDDASDKARPGVLVVQDWTGLGDYVKGRAQQLAELGCVAFCADIYGKGVRPTDPKDCGAQAGKWKADRPALRTRVQAGLAVLVKNPLVQKGKVAAIGYCFGGTTVLELARSGAEVQGVVSFHGGLSTPTPEDAKNIKGRVLVCHGADDPFVKADEVAAFHKEMAAVKYKFVPYPGAVHSFTNPAAGDDNSKGAAYNAAADKASWAEMKEFFALIFAK